MSLRALQRLLPALGHGSGEALAARAAQALTLLAAAVCVTTGFSLAEQGVFFVFLSFAALIQVGDVGLGYAALQVSSHLLAQGDAVRLRSFVRRTRRLALLALGAAAALVAVLGAALLQQRAGAAPAGTGVAWVGPWWVFVVCVLLAQWVGVELLLLEGARSVRLAWQGRLLQEAAAGVAFIVALLLGAGLWSLPLYWGLRALLGAAWCRGHPSLDRPAAGTSEGTTSRQAVDWRREVWPFQWRVGVSAFSGFLVFQAFNPIVWLQQGSESAGRFGLSLAIMNLLLLVTSAWPLSLAARYGQMLQQGHAEELRLLFRRTLFGSTMLALVLALAVLLVHSALQQGLPGLALRMADRATTAALLLSGVLNHLCLAVAVLLRAERREPLLALSVVGGVLTVSCVWLAARQGGLFAPAAASAALATVGVCWVALLYRDFARRVFAAPLAQGLR